MALISELIGNVLIELDKTRDNYEAKRNYLVDEVTLEINVKKIISGRAGVKIYIANIGSEGQFEDSHKIIVKLKPKLKKDGTYKKSSSEGNQSTGGSRKKKQMEEKMKKV